MRGACERKKQGKWDCRGFYIYLCQVQGRAQSTDEGQTGSNCLEDSHEGGGCPAFPLTSINEMEKMASARQIEEAEEKQSRFAEDN